MAHKLYYRLKVTGCTAPSGDLYAIIEQNGKEWFVRHKALMTDPSRTIQSLSEQGLVSVGRGFAAQVLEDLQAITAFPDREVLQHMGWNGSLYARPDGEVLAPASIAAIGETPGIGFRRQPNRYRVGDQLSWKRKKAEYFANDDIVTGLMGLTLAPVIRSLLPRPVAPIACQLVTADLADPVRRLLLSLTGSMTADFLACDTVEALVAHPARFIDGSRDNILVVGDIAAYIHGGPAKKRIADVRALLFDHLLPSDGGETNGVGTLAPSFVIVENSDLAELLDLNSAAADRFNQQVPSMSIGASAIEGRVGQAGTVDPTSRLLSQAFNGLKDHQGVALRTFQNRLVEQRAKQGLPALQGELDHDFAEFCDNVHKKFGTDAISERLLGHFALISTALQAANRLKVLTTTGRKSRAARHLFNQFLPSRPVPVSAAAILTELAARFEVLKVDEVSETYRKADLEKVPAFIKPCKDGSRELWVPTAQKKEVFDWPNFRKLPDFTKWYRGKAEHDRDGVKRVIGGWKDARVLRFHLP